MIFLFSLKNVTVNHMISVKRQVRVKKKHFFFITLSLPKGKEKGKEKEKKNITLLRKIKYITNNQ